MAKDRVTLVLNGNVRISDLAKATTALSRLIEQLGKEIAPECKIDWIVDELQAGSASMSLHGSVSDKHETQNLIAVEKVVKAYENVGRAACEGNLREYSKDIQADVIEIASLIDTGIQSVRFETDEYDAEIIEVPSIGDSESRVTKTDGIISEEPIVESAYGSVRGRVQSLSNRGRLRFTLYDIIDDHPISCYVEPGNEKKMRDLWGKLAIVEGYIKRDRKTGRAATVRKISILKVLPEKGSFREALGVIPRRKDDMEPSENIIRRIRDAE